MKSWLLQALFDLRYSYWFIPTVMAFAAVVLAVVMVSLDIYVFTEIPTGYEWLFRSQPAGARAILSTVAGSTITVAGVVFSMTIMSVSHATSNYGSRLLLKFLKDLRNQIALGTFTATFIYCLLVLRTVSSADANGTDFVPHLAILGALGMALASVAVLIAFIHHVPDSIHIGEVASDRGQELIHRLDEQFPEEQASSQTEHYESALFTDPTHTITSGQLGYLQALDVSGLLGYCSEHKLVVKVLKAGGDFVHQGEPIVEFSGGDSNSEDHQTLRDFFGIGNERTPAQDTRFLIEELNQVAIRALSPGINDPFTAITCLDWLGGAVAHVSDRAPRCSQLRDQQQILRVILPTFGFDDLCAIIFLQLRPHVSRDTQTSLHMAKIFTNILSCTHTENARSIVFTHAQAYAQEALASGSNEQDKQRLSEAFSIFSDV